MRVLQVLPSLNLGGAEHVGAFLACHFSGHGTPALASIRGGPIAQTLHDNRVQYKVFELDHPPSLPARALNYACRWGRRAPLPRQLVSRAASQAVLSPTWDNCELMGCKRWFRSVLEKSQATVVHIHSVFCSGLIRTAHDFGLPVFFGQHNILSERHGPEDVAFLREQLRFVRGVFCAGEFCKRDFCDITSYDLSKTRVIANPSFHFATQAKDLHEIRVFGTLSNLGEPKRIDTLLSAWQDQACISDRLELRIAGGDDRSVAYWRNLAQAMSVNVTFLGSLRTAAQVASFYESLDAFVLPSSTEAFPLVVCEAMSRGLPVIASDIPALRDILNESGTYFPAGDSSALAASIRDLHNAPSIARQLGRLGRQRWLTRWSNEAILRQYTDAYRTCWPPESRLPLEKDRLLSDRC